MPVVSNRIETKAKLRWRCHRGMLELDLIFIKFFEQCFDDLSQAQLEAFEALLEQPDPELYAFLLNKDPVNDPGLEEIVQLIRAKI